MSLRLPLMCFVALTFAPATTSIADDANLETAAMVTRLEVEALVEQYRDSQQKFESARSKAKTREERDKVTKVLKPSPVKRADSFVDWAKANPKDELATDILVLIVVHGEKKTKSTIQAGDLLASDHLDLDGERFQTVAMNVFDALSPDKGETWMRVFADRGHSRQTQALACLLLAKMKAGMVRYAELLSNPRFKQELENRMGKDQLQYIEQLDVEQVTSEAEALFERFLTEFPDVTSKGVNLADAVKNDYFAVSKLAIGKPAPELDGQDLDGKRMLLNDYRGKVVVICFWGTWCEPCIRMVPHHQELIATHKDDPFAFLGVATDQDREKLDAAMETHGITWRNWWDGGEGDGGGRISKEWSIKQWPSIFVLDHKGIIRGKNLSGEQLDATVADLLEKTHAE